MADKTPSTPSGSTGIAKFFPRSTEPRPKMRQYKKKIDIRDYCVPRNVEEITPLVGNSFNFSRVESGNPNPRRKLPLEDTSSTELADIASDGAQSHGSVNDENRNPISPTVPEPRQSTPRPRRASKDKAKEQISRMVSPSRSPDNSDEESFDLSDSATPGSSMSEDHDESLESIEYEEEERQAPFTPSNGDSNLSFASGYSSSQTPRRVSKQLVNLLNPVRAHWTELAAHLDLPFDTIEVIERDHPQNTTRQFHNFLAEWLRNNPKKEDLVEALQEMRYLDLSQAVKDSDLEL